MTEDEVKLKVGVDGTRVEGEMTGILSKLKARLSNGKEWKEAGEKAGESFAHAFGGRMLLRMGIYFAVLKGTEKASEVFGVKDKVANFFNWNADKEEEQANKDQDKVNEKMEKFEKEKIRYKREEAKLVREIHALDSKATDDEKELDGLVAKMKEAQTAVAEFKRSDGNNNERLKLELEFRNDIVAVRTKEHEIAKKATAEEKKALEERKKKLKEELEEKEKLARLDVRQERLSREYRKEQDKVYDQYKPGIEALAGAGWKPLQFNLGGGPFQYQARTIENLRARAEYQFSRGQDVWAKQNIDNANKRYDWLADKGIVPQRQDKVNEKLIRLSDDMADIAQQRVTIMVKPKTGE